MSVNTFRNKHLASALVTVMAVHPLLARRAFAQSVEGGEVEEIQNFSDSAPGVAAAGGEQVKKQVTKARSAPVSGSGAFLHTVSIDVPPGRLGMTPTLALTYSSAGAEKSSPVGAGWSLALPRIARSTRNGFPSLVRDESAGTPSASGLVTLRYDDARAEFLSPSGELARVDEPALVTSGTVYSPRREAAPIRYEYLPSTSLEGGMWIEHDPSGAKRYYGSDPRGRSARIRNELGTHVWLLVSEQDRHGNLVEYEYSNEDAQYRQDMYAAQRAPLPSRIRWGGNINGTPHVFFVQTTIEDVPQDGNAGVFHYELDMLGGHVFLDQKITEIAVGNELTGEVYWTYNLTLEPSGVTGRLLLTRLTREAATDPFGTRWVRDFHYEQTQPRFGPSVPLVGNGLPTDEWVYTQHQVNCGLGVNSCIPQDEYAWTISNAWTPRGLRSGTHFVDFDGDGTTDIVYHPAGLGTPGSELLHNRSFVRPVMRDSFETISPYGPGLAPLLRYSTLADVDGDRDLDGLVFPIHDAYASTNSIGQRPYSGAKALDDLCHAPGFWDMCGDVDPLPPDFLTAIPTPLGKFVPETDTIAFEFAFDAKIPATAPVYFDVLDPSTGTPMRPAPDLLQGGANGVFTLPRPEPWGSGPSAFPVNCLPMVEACWNGTSGRPNWPPPTVALPPQSGSGIQVTLIRNTYVETGFGSNTQILDAWPPFAVKSEVLTVGDESDPRKAAFKLDVVDDFYAPVADVNADGRGDIVLLKYFSTLGWLSDSRVTYFEPRVYRYIQDCPDPSLPCVPERWQFDWLNDTGDTTTQFTASLLQILLRSGQGTVAGSDNACVADPLYPPMSGYSAFLFDVNADGLPDLVAGREPSAATGECVAGHDVFLNRGYGWDTRLKRANTAPGESWSAPAGSDLAQHTSHPLLLVRNHEQRCPGDRETWGPTVPTSVMAISDVNIDGRPDIVISYAVKSGGSYASASANQQTSCSTNVDCPEGESCRTGGYGSGVCLPHRCTQDADCSAGFLCRGWPGELGGQPGVCMVDEVQPIFGSVVERTYLNTGKGFVPATRTFLPTREEGGVGFAFFLSNSHLLTPGAHASNDRARLVDLDSDGLPDYVRAGGKMSDVVFGSTVGIKPRVSFNQGERPDLLRRVEDASGGWTEVDYVAATSREGREVVASGSAPPAGLMVVRRIRRARGPTTREDAWTSSSPLWGVAPFTYATETVDLHYDTFVRDLNSSEAIGFERVETTFHNSMPDGTEAESVVVARRFDVRECVPELPDCAVPYPLKGAVREVVVWAGTTIRTSLTQYHLESLGNRAVRLRLSRQIEQECSAAALVSLNPTGDEMCRASQTDWSTFDAYGFVKTVEAGNSTYQSGDDVSATTIIADDELATTQTVFEHKTATWVLGLAARQTTYGFRQDVAGDSYSGAVLRDVSREYAVTGLLLNETRLGITAAPCGGSQDSRTDYAYRPEDMGLLGTVTFPEGRLETVTYEPLKLYPDSRSTTISRFEGGVAVGQTTLAETYEFDPRLGLLETRVDPNGQTFLTFHDSLGRVVEERGPDGVRSLSTYHDDVPPTVETEVFREDDVSYLRVGYLDAARNVLAATEGPHDGAVAWAYDNGLRGAVRTRAVELDAFGREVVSYLPRFATSLSDVSIWTEQVAERREYDGLDRVVREELPGNRVTTVVYGAWAEQAINPRGVRTLRLRDWQANLTVVEHFKPASYGVDTSLGAYVYSRDGLGQINQVLDPDGLVRNLERDKGGRLLAANLPHVSGSAPGTFAFCYDLEDTLTSVETPAGRAVDVLRDELRRAVVTTATFGSDKVVSLNGYDSPSESNALGRISSVGDDSGQWDFGYDVYGRRNAVRYRPSRLVESGRWGSEYSLDVGYDRSGNLLSFEIGLPDVGANAVSVDYNRDPLGVVTHVTSTGREGGSADLAFDVALDAQMRLRHVGFGNGTSTVWTYGPDTQFLTNVSFLDNTGHAFAELVYSDFDANGNVGVETRSTFGGALSSYKRHTYDWLDRLESSTLQVPSQDYELVRSFGYSAGGNIETADATSYEYGEAFNAQAVTGITGNGLWRQLGYDADGQLGLDQLGGAYGSHDRTLDWDASGCLRSVTEYVSGSLSSETEAICGPDGRRVARLSTDYAGGAPETKRVVYLFGAGEIRLDDQVFLLRLPVSGTTVVEGAWSLFDGTLVPQESGYVHLDMRGSFLARSSYYEPADGTAVELVEEAEYGAWGETLLVSELDAPTHQFTGLEPDPGTSLYSMGRRVYDPTLRRWLSPDPLLFAAPEVDGVGNNLNLYSYAGNNPVAHVDPDGTFAITLPTLALIAAWAEAEAAVIGLYALAGAALGAWAGAGGGGGGKLENMQDRVLEAKMAEWRESKAKSASASSGGNSTGADPGEPGDKKDRDSSKPGGEVHGNSKASTRSQHRYEINDNQAGGDVVKTGISGRPLNKNGTSPRANQQVNNLNRADPGRYSASVKEQNLPGRQSGLDAEQAATNQLSRDGNTLRLQRRPKPE